MQISLKVVVTGCTDVADAKTKVQAKIAPFYGQGNIGKVQILTVDAVTNGATYDVTVTMTADL